MNKLKRSGNHAAAAAAAGARLERVRTCMERYVSELLVKGMLDRTLATRGLAYETIRDADVATLVQDSMVGLRLFVDREKLPSLMLELAEILEET